MATIISIFLYLGTIFFGFVLDSKTTSNKVRKYRLYFEVWLYVFLCFGYMTGSDWRSYEDIYDGSGAALLFYSNEPASAFLLHFAPSIIPDFWILLALLKCLYLYSSLKLAKYITKYWISTTAILIILCNSFMLIENPLRFMLGCIVINYILLYLLKQYPNYSIRDFFISTILVVVASLFHNTCVFFIVLFPICILAKRMERLNNNMLIVGYIIVLFVASSLNYIESIKVTIINLLLSGVEMKDYTTSGSYGDASSLLSIGNILKIIFFLLIIQYRNSITSGLHNGRFIFSLAVIYMYLERLLLLIPTGFRLSIPFCVFYGACVSIMYFYNKRVISIFILYLGLSFAKNIWTSYEYLPYTNSIPYILSGHESRSFREDYNLNAYKDRTGSDYIFQEYE